MDDTANVTLDEKVWKVIDFLVGKEFHWLSAKHHTGTGKDNQMEAEWRVLAGIRVIPCGTGKYSVSTWFDPQWVVYDVDEDTVAAIRVLHTATPKHPQYSNPYGNR